MKAVIPVGIGLVSAAYLVMRVLSEKFTGEKFISIASFRPGVSTHDKKFEEDQEAFAARCESHV
ncbi:hypothetical protein BGX24_009986 [Mortierella sp. AD032]|nr:hypothetical protein BGX24_009986 [Mortierella sp. AD032]